MEILLGTGEVARICGVSQATIKRWADEGALACVRTLGGHRRFLARDLRRFLTTHDYQVPAELGGRVTGEGDPEGVSLYALNDEFERVAERFVDRALEPGSERPEAILRTLLTLGIPLPRIYQRVVVPGLARIRELGELGQVGVIETQVALTRIEEVLVRLQPHVSRVVRRGRLALVAALAPEPQRIVVRLAGNLLDAEGWTVAATREPVSASGVVDYLRRERPELLCVPAETPGDAGVFLEQVALVHGACREVGTPLVLVGGAAALLTPTPEAEKIVPDLPSLVEASREV